MQRQKSAGFAVDYLGSTSLIPVGPLAEHDFCFRSADQRLKEALVVFAGNGVIWIVPGQRRRRRFQAPRRLRPGCENPARCESKPAVFPKTSGTLGIAHSAPPASIVRPYCPAPPRPPSVPCDHWHAVAVDVPAPHLIRMWDNEDIRSTESGSSMAASKSCG